MSSRGYDGDMAYAHHTGHSDFARAAAGEVVAQLRAADLCEGLVLDLGCGTGVLARELTQHGYDVHGVELSTAMLEIARQTVPKATFVHGSYLDVALPSCAAALGIGQTFGYTFDPRNDSAALSGLFRRIWHALRPGGLLIFDLNTPSSVCEEHWRDAEDWLMATRTIVSGEQMTRDITLFRREGDHYRRSNERHVVLLHDPGTVLAELDAVGYSAHCLQTYGPMQLSSELAAYLAVKPW